MISDNISISKGIFWANLCSEATALAAREHGLQPLLAEVIHKHSTFKDALFFRIAAKLGGFLMTVEDWVNIFNDANSISSSTKGLPDLESLAIMDIMAIKDRDPACDSILTAFLHFKGYKAIQTYRAAHSLWRIGRKELAVAIQSTCSEVFGVDIHPGAVIQGGLMIDHATGVVIGETATIGRNCSILHGVTLGSSGKDKGDRHPKVGDDVLIGCNAIILGNIAIGNNCNIGAGSIVLKSLPPGVTAVGNPARIVGRTTPEHSGMTMDTALKDVVCPCGTLYKDTWIA